MLEFEEKWEFLKQGKTFHNYIHYGTRKIGCKPRFKIFPGKERPRAKFSKELKHC
ncbi:MAG: hypothetical protein LWW94_07095 [Candidatus Desulfofervidaceae bacterium]|nr:hypothetical protein [Candidatus Desulfofervidaceae bacterium]